MKREETTEDAVEASAERKETPAETQGETQAEAETPVAEAEAEATAPPPDERPRTPPDWVPVPAPGPDGRHDLSLPTYFLNRELTGLNFQFRVLQEARDARVPLLERLKFIAIVSSNLDEFFMKRIGGLKQLVGADVSGLSLDGRTPQQQIAECYDVVRRLEQRKVDTLHDVLKACRRRDIELKRFRELSPDDRAYLRAYYIDNIFPLVTPQATDPAHPFPFISNLSLNLLVTLHHPADQIPALARVKVPVGVGCPRFLQLEGKNTFVALEDVMANNLDLLFPGMEVEHCELFRVTRNANTEIEEETADDLLEMIETELRERKFAPIVRLQVSKDMVPEHRGMLAAELGLDAQADVFEVDDLLAMRDLMELAQIRDGDLHDPPHHPIDHPGLDPDRSIFHTIRDAGSILLHHPFESFATSVERFLREASRDPKVRAIKMTLYRTSGESKAIQYLLDAARNGKQVAVVVELKARFDEAANIRWAARLNEAGIHVTYGVVGLKTHCKAILVVRQDHDGLRRYAHLGTGNYNAVTARLYCDLGLLTADPQIGHDLTELFNYLTTGYKPKRNYLTLLPAPKIMRQALLERIAREVEWAGKGEKALLQFKINALEDEGITRALYEAARAGVKIDLIVRDTCRLRPGIPGLTENVRVVSILGRFLEHARIYYFRNGGDEEYFIASGDTMRRNLNSRVEIVAPIDPALCDELRFLIDVQLADKRGGWDMQPDGSYVQRASGRKARSSQETLIERAEKRVKSAKRLRRRKPRGPQRRN